jgi:hypothetical protein
MHRPTDIRGPTVGIVDAARRRRAANEVVDEVRRNLEDLTARPNDLPKMFAVAAVARLRGWSREWRRFKLPASRTSWQSAFDLCLSLS